MHKTTLSLEQASKRIYLFWEYRPQKECYVWLSVLKVQHEIMYQRLGGYCCGLFIEAYGIRTGVHQVEHLVLKEGTAGKDMKAQSNPAPLDTILQKLSQENTVGPPYPRGIDSKPPINTENYR